MASAASCPRLVDIHATLKSAAAGRLGPARSTGSEGPDEFSGPRVFIRSFAVPWFPNSPRCEPMLHADCIGGAPISVSRATLRGNMGADCGGGGTLHDVVVCRCRDCVVELVLPLSSGDERLSLDKRVNEWSVLAEAFSYSQHGSTMCPEGAVSNWYTSVPSGSPFSNS